MSSSAPGGRSRIFRLWLIAAVIMFGRTLPAAAQDWPDWQMFLGIGVGAQLVCQSGRDPTDHHYQVEILRADAVDIRRSVQDAFRKARWLDERRGCNPCMEPSTWFRHEVSVHVAAIWK